MQPLLRLESSPLIGERRVQAIELLDRDEAIRFDTDPHRERFLTGRMLLRELAAGFTGMPLDSITIAAACPDCTRPHGRPLIEGTGLHVSLSHAGDLTLAALLDGTAIGVDLETVEASPERLEAIREVAGGIGIAHWTRVEAVLKADGRGLRVDPRGVVIRDAEAELDGRRYELSEPDVGRDHVATVAVERHAVS